MSPFCLFSTQMLPGRDKGVEFDRPIAASGNFRGAPSRGLTSLDLLFMVVLAISFVFTHRASYARIMESDQRGRPNIGGVMFLPYLRIVPMHLTIILGLSSGYTGGVVLFGTRRGARQAREREHAGNGKRESCESSDSHEIASCVGYRDSPRKDDTGWSMMPVLV